MYRKLVQHLRSNHTNELMVSEQDAADRNGCRDNRDANDAGRPPIGQI
jgi:hypothetical protein